MIRYCLIVLCLYFSLDGFAQSYIIDSTFGKHGVAKIKSTDSNFTIRNLEGNAAVIESNRKISFLHHHIDETDVLHLYPGVIKFNPDGLSVDSTFGNLGVAQKILLPKSSVSVFNHNISASLAIGFEGKFLIGGQKKRHNFSDYTGRVVCFTNNGNVDAGFGNNGLYLDSSYNTFRTFEIHPLINNGYLLLSYDNVNFVNIVSALNSNGNIDLNFGTNGFQTFDMYSQPFEDIVYRSISIIDNSYYVSFIAIDSNVGAYWPKYSGFVKLKPNGIPDSTFGQFGRVILNSHLQNKFIDDRGVITNKEFTTTILKDHIIAKLNDTLTSKKYICSFNKLGFLETTFGVNGYSIFDPPKNNTSQTFILRLHALKNDKIVVLGQTLDTATSIYKSNYFVALYNKDGILDSSFGLNGYYNLTNIIIDDASLNGNILSIDSNNFYITGSQLDLTSANYYDGFYCMIRFKLNATPTFLNEVITENQDVEIAPNPIISELNISCKNKIDEIKIIDSYGKVVLFKSIHQQQIKLDLSDLASSIYYLNIKTDHGVIHKKITKL